MKNDEKTINSAINSAINLAGNTILQTYVRDDIIFYTNRLWKGAADGKHFMCQYSGTDD
jgi:hypothetical protein